MKSSFDHLYSARKHFVVNYGDGIERDPDLTPIVFTLPSPPDDWSKVKNYGLHPDDQVYRVDAPPKRLVLLEEEIMTEANKRYESNRNNTITGYGLLKAFWEKLSNEAEV